jgi:hypothetical protein
VLDPRSLPTALALLVAVLAVQLEWVWVLLKRDESGVLGGDCREVPSVLQASWVRSGGLIEAESVPIEYHAVVDRQRYEHRDRRSGVG